MKYLKNLLLVVVKVSLNLVLYVPHGAFTGVNALYLGVIGKSHRNVTTPMRWQWWVKGKDVE